MTIAYDQSCDQRKSPAACCCRLTCSDSIATVASPGFKGWKHSWSCVSASYSWGAENAGPENAGMENAGPGKYKIELGFSVNDELLQRVSARTLHV